MLHAAIFVFALATSAAAAPRELTFEVASRGEAVARITVTCDHCRWDTAGREAAVFSIAVDGRYNQHLVAIRSGEATYEVLLGAMEPGSHTLRIEEDATLTAKDIRGGRAKVGAIVIDVVAARSALPRALAPILYARPNTLGKFTDVPVFMWYEILESEHMGPAHGTRYRYSVIFTNEDGGTPADRLMATWGRTTDIEYVYSVEFLVETSLFRSDGTNREVMIFHEDFQGPEHKILPFNGKRDGRHPLLWVSTDNNMVLDEGSTTVRYALAPVPFPLDAVSREAVMDAHPWLYRVMTQELAREGKIVPDAAPGTGAIPDPRNFVYIQGCGVLNRAPLAFAVRAKGRWIASDRGVPAYRIARDGCFRAAIPLPPGTRLHHITGLRAQAYPSRSAADEPPDAVAPAYLFRLNKVFMLDDRYRPGPSRFEWTGSITLTPDGPPVELPLK